MKNFRFESIYLLSQKEKKARKETFHPKLNLLIGRNHTGKSSLIKTIFLTLGARPNGKLMQWDENTVSALYFICNGKKYTALHHQGIRALFDDKLNLIISTGEYSKWTNEFIKITGFNLTLINKSNETVPADPKCFFLPFYINQDGSWQTEWNTFVGLQGFKAPNSAILDYFAGIKPPLYYEIQAKKKLIQLDLENLHREQKFLERAKDRMSKSLTLNGPKLNEQNFELEIISLTKEVTELNRQQELYRDKVVHDKETVENINHQINLAIDALKTYDLDAKYLEKNDREILTCPTCGAEHKDSFIDILTYSEDSRVLRELVNNLKSDSERAIKEYNISKNTLDDLRKRYKQISEILNTRKGDLLFRDVVDSAGSEKAFRAFEDESQLLNNDIKELLLSLDNLDRRLIELLDKKKSKEILTIFRESYSAYRSKLNLPILETKKMSLISRPNISGSGGPRSILAYYAALWKTCMDNSENYFMPIVIDSPNQQAQDDVNMPIILDFIANNLPTDAQVIVGSEIDTDFKFDKKFKFNTPYGLLEKNQFEEINSHLEPLLKIMYDNIIKLKK